MTVIFKKTKGLTDSPFSYCPGCTHGIIHRLVAECLEELEVLDRSIVIASVGCSVMSYEYFNCDAIQAAHGARCLKGTMSASSCRPLQPVRCVPIG